jgi:hypothetical protein
MGRPKRMGAYNALDDLLPGPAWDQGPAWDPDPADEPDPPPRRPRLLPVPGPSGLDDLLPGPADPPVRHPGASRPRSAGRHLGVWNPLDGPPAPRPAPDPAPPPPPKARVSFRLPADLVETARDAVAHLAGTADQTTLTALTERALRVELARLSITHNAGRPFPPRAP